MMYVCTNIKDIFNSNEQEDGGKGVVDHNYNAHDIRLHMKVIPQIFKTLMDFIVIEFDELYELVVVVITSHVQ